jgi:hypothetical protein
MKFGFEFVYLRKSFLSKLDIRQNILLKNILGIHHRARFKIVLNIMKVEQVSLLYEKHKVFGWTQCTKNSLTEKIFDSLSLVNSKNKLSYLSYLNQLSLVVGSKELGHCIVFVTLFLYLLKIFTFCISSSESLTEPVKFCSFL